jgi:hypothetical protein
VREKVKQTFLRLKGFFLIHFETNILKIFKPVLAELEES